KPLDLGLRGFEKVHLTLQLGFNLFEREALPAQLTHSPELCQSAEVIERLACCRLRGRGNHALVSPTPNHPVAETKELFDFLDGVGRLDPLIVGFYRRRGREPENLGTFFGHPRKLSLGCLALPSLLRLRLLRFFLLVGLACSFH